MRFFIESNSKLGDVGRHRIVDKLEEKLAVSSATLLSFGRLQAIDVGDEIGFPVDKAADLFARVGRHEIVAFAVEAITELVIAAHYEWHVVQ